MVATIRTHWSVVLKDNGRKAYCGQNVEYNWLYTVYRSRDDLKYTSTLIHGNCWVSQLVRNMERTRQENWKQENGGRSKCKNEFLRVAIIWKYLYHHMNDQQRHPQRLQREPSKINWQDYLSSRCPDSFPSHPAQYTKWSLGQDPKAMHEPSNKVFPQRSLIWLPPVLSAHLPTAEGQNELLIRDLPRKDQLVTQ